MKFSDPIFVPQIYFYFCSFSELELLRIRMGCDLCHKSETVIEKPITDLVRKLKSVKQERARRGRQWDRATEKHARINEIKAEIERVKNRFSHFLALKLWPHIFSIESLKDGFRMLTRENMEAKSAKNKLATIEKVDCEKKIHKIEYKTRELVNYWIGDEVNLLKKIVE